MHACMKAHRDTTVVRVRGIGGRALRYSSETFLSTATLARKKELQVKQIQKHGQD